MNPLLMKLLLIVAALIPLLGARFLLKVEKNSELEEVTEEIFEQAVESQTGVKIHIPD